MYCTPLKIADCKKINKKGAAFPATYLCKVWSVLCIWKQLLAVLVHLLVRSSVYNACGSRSCCGVAGSYYRIRYDTASCSIWVVFFFNHSYWSVWKSPLLTQLITELKMTKLLLSIKRRINGEGSYSTGVLACSICVTLVTVTDHAC